MKYSPEFLETNARLKTLDEETLNDELNNMTTDELWAHGDYMIQQTFKEEDLLSEEEAQAHINELLQLTREPVEEERKSIKVHTHRTAKRILVLAAAILVLVSVFMVAAVASKRDFSILNGIVRFEEGKVYVSFSKNSGEPNLTLSDLETELRNHGFEYLKLPNYFYNNNWKSTQPKYYTNNLKNQVNFILKYGREQYTVDVFMSPDSSEQKGLTFKGVENGETLFFDESIAIYFFDHGKNRFEIKAFINNYNVEIISSEFNQDSELLIRSLRQGEW